MLDEKAMLNYADIILEYVSITLLSQRFNFEVYESEDTIEINLTEDSDEMILERINRTDSLIKFEIGTHDSNYYEKKLCRFIDYSIKELNQIKMILNHINALPYEYRYILIKGVLLQEHLLEICTHLKISKATYYRMLHDGKRSLAFTIPETFRIKTEKQWRK